MAGSALHLSTLTGQASSSIPGWLDPDAQATVTAPVPHDFVPKTLADLRVCLDDPMWRLCSGVLYKIKTKPKDENGEEDEDAEPLIVPFKPNRAQRRLLKRMHKRNIILKARQLGFTTFIAILFLDTALFANRKAPASCAIVAHTQDAAEEIFRDKIRFAYDSLPAQLRDAMPLARDRADKVEFSHNGSWIRVATSFRSGTLTHLHISEFGKICAKFADRAEEVITGSIPAAEMGLIFIESTAEGREGHFYKMTQRSRRIADLGRRLTNKEFRFHFYPWWDDPHYRVDPEFVEISYTEHEYFDEVEAKMGCHLDIEQRAWWVSTRDNVYSGEDSKMWQEYPSTPDEAFQQSTKASYYAVQMTRARKEKRIARVPFDPSVPVNTFWDLGSRDGTAIWLHQQVGPWHNFIGFIEGWGEHYSHYVSKLDEFQRRTGCVWGRHYLPHDGAHERQGETNNNSPRTMLENLGLRRIEIVDRVLEIQHGIQATRDFLALCRFDEVACKEGITHIDSYKRTFNERLQVYTEIPVHDEHSEAADALRQAAQTFIGANHQVRAGKRPNRRNKSGMAT